MATRKKQAKEKQRKKKKSETEPDRGFIARFFSRGATEAEAAPPEPATEERSAVLVEVSPLRRASSTPSTNDPNLPTEGTDGIFFASPTRVSLVFGVRCLNLVGNVQPRVLTVRARCFWDGVQAAYLGIDQRPTVARALLYPGSQHTEDIDQEVDWSAREEPPDGAAVLVQMSGSFLFVDWAAGGVPREEPFVGKLFLRVTRQHS